MLGSVLNQRFHLDGELRRGRSGVAYVATDEASGELFALKVFANGAGMEGPGGAAYRARLRQLRELNPAHAIVSAKVGRADGRWYVATPYFPGDPLPLDLTGVGFTAAEGIEVLCQLAEGLAELHDRGAVHGGILPRRILVSRVDGVHAVLVNPARYLLTQGSALPAADAAFSAPEQDPRHELPVDARADLYALGVLALRLMTGAPQGQAPADAGAFRAAWAGIEADRARAAPEVPAALRPVLGRLVAVNPEQRYPSAAHLLSDLRHIGGASTDARARPELPRLALGAPREMEAPRSAIQARLGMACTGTGGAVVLQGWDGVGVEPVLRSVLPDLEAAGALILRAGASEGGPCPPLSAARQWFADYHRQLDLLPPSHGDALRLRLDGVASRLPTGLEAIIPELTALDSAAHPSPLEASLSPRILERRRATVLARVCEALAALAEPSHPLVLWIRELAALDADSLHLLRLLLYRAQDAPILILAGFHAPPGGGNAVESLLGAPALLASITRVALPLLNPQQTEQQMVRLLGCAETRNERAIRTAREVAERVYPMWFGVPWAQEQTVRLMVEEGRLVREAVRGNGTAPEWIAAGGLKDWEAPESLAALVWRRWAFLADECRGSLEAAAVLAAPFSEQDVAGLRDERPFEAVCEDVEGCVSMGWLTRRAGGYAFAEPFVQRILYAGMDSERRRELHVAASALAQGWLAAGHLHQAGDFPQLWSVAAPEMEAETWPACGASLLAPLIHALPHLPEPGRTEAAHSLAQIALALGEDELAQSVLEDHGGRTAHTQARACLLRAYAAPGEDAAPWVLRACEAMGEPLPSGGLGSLLGKAALNRGGHTASAEVDAFAAALPMPSAQQSARLSLLDAAAEALQGLDPERAGILDARILDETAACEAPALRLRALLRLGAHSALPDGYYFLQARHAVAREELSHLAPGYHLAVGIAAAGELELAAAAEALARADRGYRAEADPVGRADVALEQWKLARLTGPMRLLERSTLDLQSAAGCADSAIHALFAAAARIETEVLAGRREVREALAELARLVDGARATAGLFPWKRLAAHALNWALLLRVRPDEGHGGTFAVDSAPEAVSPADATLLLAAAEWRLAETAFGAQMEDPRARLTNDALARASKAASRRRAHRTQLALLDAMAAGVRSGLDGALARLEDALVTAEVHGARFLSIHFWWRLAEGARQSGDSRWMTWAGKALTASDALEAHGLTSRVRTWIDTPLPALAPPAAAAAPSPAEQERPSPRTPAHVAPPSGAEEIVPDGTVGLVSGRIRGLALLAARAPNDWRQMLDRYYERLEFTLSLHRLALVARGRTGWSAIAPAGALSAFWATHTIRPLVTEYTEEIAGAGAEDPLLLRTGIGVHTTAAPADGPPEAALLVGDAVPQAERLADLSAFLRAGPVLSPEMTDRLPPVWKETLRPLGPWALGTPAGTHDLFAFAGAPGAGGMESGAGTQDIWSQALTAYRTRDWRNAIAGLKTFLSAHPGDRLARLLLRHSQRRFTGRARLPGTTL